MDCLLHPAKKMRKQVIQGQGKERNRPITQSFKTTA